MSGAMIFTIVDDEGYEKAIELRTHREVCPRCNGDGTHVNPAIDGNGIPADEFYYEWGEEERQMYLSGGYDIVCEECMGNKVVDVVDETDPNYHHWARYQQQEWEYQMEVEAERRMGA